MAGELSGSPPKARPTLMGVVSPPYEIDIKRSDKRSRTISARLRGATLEVTVPARMSKAEAERWAAQMAEKVARKREPRSDLALMERAAGLSRKLFEGRLRPRSVRWVDNQNGRWGSCSVETGDIRLNSRLKEYPRFVQDYVIVHEIVHLQVAGHGKDFWAMTGRFPLAERAIGYLIAKGGEVD